jgi:hypothetical protein
MPRKGDIRRHERVPQAAPVQVSWKDRLGHEKFANAEIVDVSEAGMRVKVPESLAEQHSRHIALRQTGLAGAGIGPELCQAEC